MEPIKEFLVVCDYYETGLATKSGLIRIENIVGKDKGLIEAFNQWLDESPIKARPLISVRVEQVVRPLNSDHVREHNIKGFELAKRIKGIVAKDTKVEYSCIEANTIYR